MSHPPSIFRSPSSKYIKLSVFGDKGLDNEGDSPKKGLFRRSSSIMKDDPTPRGAKRKESDSIIGSPDKIRRILQLETRTDYEAKLLYESIKDFLFFQTFNERNKSNHFETGAFVHLCKNMKYEKLPAGSVVFKEGDNSNGKMYIVYDGEVKVITKNQDVFVKQNIERDRKQKMQNIKLDTSTSYHKSTTFATEISGENENNGHPLSRSTSRVSNPKYIPELTAVTEATEEARSLSPSNRQRSIFFPMKSGFSAMSEEGKTPLRKRRSSIKPIDPTKNTTEHKPSAFKMDRTGSNISDIHSDLPLMRNRSTSDPRRHGISSQNSIGSSHFAPKNNRQSIFSSQNSGISDFSAKYSDEELTLDEKISLYGSIKDTIYKGGFFGELALFSNQKRTATIMTTTETELLIIEKNDFRFVSDNYDQKKKKIVEFMFKYFPDVENINTYSIVEGLLYLLEEKSYLCGDYLGREGQKGNRVYIIYDGECELTKNLMVESSTVTGSLKGYLRATNGHNVELSLFKVEAGVFIGDEIFFSGEGVYNFSVKVTSANAVIFSIDKDKFLRRFPLGVLEELKKVYNQKKISHEKMLRARIQNKFPNMELMEDKSRSLLSQKLKVAPKPATSANLTEELKKKMKMNTSQSLAELAPKQSIRTKEDLRQKSKSPTIRKQTFFNLVQQQVSAKEKIKERLLVLTTDPYQETNYTEGDRHQPRHTFPPSQTNSPMRTSITKSKDENVNTPQKSKADDPADTLEDILDLNSGTPEHEMAYLTPTRPVTASMSKHEGTAYDFIYEDKKLMKSLRTIKLKQLNKDNRKAFRIPSPIHKSQISVRFDHFVKTLRDKNLVRSENFETVSSDYKLASMLKTPQKKEINNLHVSSHRKNQTTIGFHSLTSSPKNSNHDRNQTEGIQKSTTQANLRTRKPTLESYYISSQVLRTGSAPRKMRNTSHDYPSMSMNTGGLSFSKLEINLKTEEMPEVTLFQRKPRVNTKSEPNSELNAKQKNLQEYMLKRKALINQKLRMKRNLSAQILKKSLEKSSYKFGGELIIPRGLVENIASLNSEESLNEK